MKISKAIISVLVVGLLIFILFRFRNDLNWVSFWAALAAIGSILVAITAVYGDFLRLKFIGPKLKIVPHNLTGNATTMTEYDKSSGKVIRQYTSYYYHLKIINERPFVPAKNCRVMLKQLHSRGPDRDL